MIGITKMSKYIALLLLILTAPKFPIIKDLQQRTSLTFKKNYINLLLLSLYKRS